MPMEGRGREEEVMAEAGQDVVGRKAGWLAACDRCRPKMLVRLLVYVMDSLSDCKRCADAVSYLCSLSRVAGEIANASSMDTYVDRT